jgi:predicted thioesterase
MTFEKTITVAEEHVPRHLAEAGAPVLSTPSMVALVEEAALDGVQPYLAAGESTVGTRVDLRHLAPSPLGMKVTARCTLAELDRRRLVFSVEVHDEIEKVGEGTHERFIVTATKQRERVEKKAGLKRQGTG